MKDNGGEVTVHTDKFNVTGSIEKGIAALNITSKNVNETVSAHLPSSLSEAIKDPKWASVKH